MIPGRCSKHACEHPSKDILISRSHHPFNITYRHVFSFMCESGTINTGWTNLRTEGTRTDFLIKKLIVITKDIKVQVYPVTLEQCGVRGTHRPRSQKYVCKFSWPSTYCMWKIASPLNMGSNLSPNSWSSRPCCSRANYKPVLGNQCGFTLYLKYTITLANTHTQCPL